VFGYIKMTREFYALMTARRNGGIVNNLGNGGERVDAGHVCGSAGNAALRAFTRALGGKSLADNIRVVGINPGPVGTDRHVTLLKTRAKHQFGDETRYKEFQKGMPRGRPAHAREMVSEGAGLVAASSTESLATAVAGVFIRAGVVCEESNDPIGVELAGAAKNAAPAWAEFYLSGWREYASPNAWNPPPGMVERTIDPTNGYLATEWCPVTRNEYYKPELPLPTISCPEHGPDMGDQQNNRDWQNQRDWSNDFGKKISKALGRIFKF